MEEINRNEGFETKITVDATAGAAAVFYGFLTIIYTIWVILLVMIWIIGGVLAFLSSFGCMFYNSSIGDKVAGFILAIFFGPFYWLFYIYKSTYCNSYPAYVPPQMVNYYN